MSEMADDLLEGEELDDDYDISNEREEALLQEDDDYSKGRDMYDTRKKESYSDTEDDVLNLDIEEDFQDDEVLDKTLYDEKPPCKKDRKFSVENTQAVKQNATAATNISVTTQSAPVAQKTNTVPQKINIKKTFMKNDKWRKGNEKGNFQPRPRFVKNNMQRRRNGTVLINPRYEGTVHINENNARLAWDNNTPQYPQNNSNLIHPWVPGNGLGNSNTNSLLVTNLVSGIASLAQQPPNMLLPQTQPPAQNFYRQQNNYEPQLSFEPPPNITEPRPPQQHFRNQTSNIPEWDNSYIPHNQVTSQQMLPPPQQSYYRQPQQHFNNQMPPNRMQGNSYPNNQQSYSYNRPLTQQQNNPPEKNLNLASSYQNKNFNYNNRPNNKFPTYNNNQHFSTQNNFQNKNMGYGNNNYQNRKFNYSGNGMKQINPNNYSPATYEDNSLNKNDFNQTNESTSCRFDVKQNNSNAFNKFQNKPPQQFQRFSYTVPQRNNNVQNQQFARPGIRRPIMNETQDTSEESPEKIPKINEKVKSDVSQNMNEQKNEQYAIQKQDDEDEETRLYRLKIEEQKRERERILRIKEERRKQMILERQKQDQDNLATVEPEEQIQTRPQPLFTKKINFEHPVVTVPVQKPNQTGPVQRSNQYHPAPFQRQNQVPTFPSASLGGPQQSQYSNDSSDPSTEISNFTFKVSNNLQSSASVTKDPEASSSSFMSNRVVVVKSKNAQKIGTVTNPPLAKPVSIESSNEPSDVGVSSFFNNRKVLKKDNSLLNTKLVVVNNLSATINQNKLMALSRGIGEIQTLRVDKQERQATILFKSVASAHAFFKKYQRRILDDLSVIEVKLEPML